MYLHDIATESLMALKNLEALSDDWNALLISMMSKRLDETTRLLFAWILQALSIIKQFLTHIEHRTFSNIDSKS